MDVFEKQKPGYQTQIKFAAASKALMFYNFVNQNIVYLEPSVPIPDGIMQAGLLKACLRTGHRLLEK